MGWQCPECDFVNEDYMIRCACGYELREPQPARAMSEQTQDGGTRFTPEKYLLKVKAWSKGILIWALINAAFLVLQWWLVRSDPGWRLTIAEYWVVILLIIHLAAAGAAVTALVRDPPRPELYLGFGLYLLIVGLLNAWVGRSFYPVLGVVQAGVGVHAAIEAWRYAVRYRSTFRNNMARGYSRIGVAHIEDKDWPEAIKNLSKAITLDPGYPDAYYNRAVALELANRWQDATNDAQRYVELAPDDPEGQELLDDLLKKAAGGSAH